MSETSHSITINAPVVPLNQTIYKPDFIDFKEKKFVDWIGENFKVVRSNGWAELILNGITVSTVPDHHEVLTSAITKYVTVAYQAFKAFQE